MSCSPTVRTRFRGSFGEGYRVTSFANGRDALASGPFDVVLLEWRMPDITGLEVPSGRGDEGYRANVRTFIKRIRNKFRESDPRFDQIENYHGFGYR